jgi:hypothetical protein
MGDSHNCVRVDEDLAWAKHQLARMEVANTRLRDAIGERERENLRILAEDNETIIRLETDLEKANKIVVSMTEVVEHLNGKIDSLAETVVVLCDAGGHACRANVSDQEFEDALRRRIPWPCECNRFTPSSTLSTDER